MQSVGAAAGVAGGVMKGEITYAPAIGKSAIATIHPLPHDVPMDLIITEDGCTPRPHCSA